MKEKKSWWHGIYPFRFIWHGEWSDPEISAYGRTINVHDFEDGLYEQFSEEMREKGVRFSGFVASCVFVLFA